ncbi:MAG: peptide chain release factor N(5)-glutamine methyltransferase [Smithellaceae bacterium]
MMIRDLLHQSAERFDAAGNESARLDAEVLLAHCLRCERVWLLTHPEQIVPDDRLTEFQAMVVRRLAREPIAYITRQKAFWTFVLEVNPGVLIPRPDTEVLVEEALAVCADAGWAAPRVLDIGTGSGAIALALAAQLPDADVTATDISPVALDTARRNARACGLEHRICFVEGDLFEPVEGLFDLIVSNPPYIGREEYETLPDGVRAFEPRGALLAGQTGLEFYEKLVYQARSLLTQEGRLLLEIGATQGEALQALLAQAGYDHIGIRADYAGWPRVIRGRRSSFG